MRPRRHSRSATIPERTPRQANAAIVVGVVYFSLRSRMASLHERAQSGDVIIRDKESTIIGLRA
jgi:hypothetical protein